jgi:hypothetical protein
MIAWDQKHFEARKKNFAEVSSLSFYVSINTRRKLRGPQGGLKNSHILQTPTLECDGQQDWAEYILKELIGPRLVPGP